MPLYVIIVISFEPRNPSNCVIVYSDLIQALEVAIIMYSVFLFIKENILKLSIVKWLL